MISAIKLSNFYSIKDNVELKFDFKVKRSSSFQDNSIYNYKDENGRKRSILNGSLIYGANASGKTNILRGFDFLKGFVASTDEFKSEKESNEKTSKLALPFVLTNSRNNVIKVELKNIIMNVEGNDYKTTYIIHYNVLSRIVEYESMHAQKIMSTKLGDEFIIFSRKNSTIVGFSNSLKGIMEKISQENIKFNSLFFYLVSDINDEFYKNEISSNQYLLIKKLYDEIINGYGLVSNSQYRLQNVASMINKDTKFKKDLIEKLNDFDFSIVDFFIEDNLETFSDSLDENDMDSDIKDNLLKFFKLSSRFSIRTIHKSNDDERIPIELESSGTRKFLSDYLYIQSAFENNYLFIEDEFDSRYHVKIQESILSDFKKYNGNEYSQFVITTQNPLLLNPTDWAKEQINFVNKKRNDESTYINRLSDYEDVSYNNHNWMNLYLEGRFGALPEVL